jgi:hypothetical protein
MMSHIKLLERLRDTHAENRFYCSADDLEICVEQEYAPLRGYPSYDRKRRRDLGPVREARDLLDLYRQTF